MFVDYAELTIVSRRSIAFMQIESSGGGDGSGSNGRKAFAWLPFLSCQRKKQ